MKALRIGARGVHLDSPLRYLQSSLDPLLKGLPKAVGT